MAFRISPAVLAALAGFALCTAGPAALAQAYPEAPKRPVVDRYHGISVSDDYQWLEDATQPEVKTWLAAENQRSRAALDAVPGRAALLARVQTLITSRSSEYAGLKSAGSRWFAIKSQPPKQQSLLVTLASPDALASEQVVLDPNVLAADGSLAIDFYEPSPDGRLVAVSMSEKGSEDGSVHVIEVATGKQIDVVVPRVQYPTAGGSVSWRHDSQGFFYTRYPAAGERAEADLHFYQQVYFHALGQPLAKDRYALGRELPRIAEIELSSAKTGEQLALVRNGDGGEVALYLLGKRGRWQRLADFSDGVKAAVFGEDGGLYLLSRKGTPRGQVLRVPLANPLLAKARVVLPEGEGTLELMTVGQGRLIVSSLLGGPSQLNVVDLKSLARVGVALPPVSSVDALVSDGRGAVLALIQSYTEPSAWYRIGADKQPVKTALAMTSVADYSDTEVVRDVATSKDGTQVPLNIIRRKGTVLDGKNPTILYGYGGYGINMTPGFSTTRRLWLEHGGVYVIANLRGGGEFGPAWHQAAVMSHKQKSYDDMTTSSLPPRR